MISDLEPKPESVEKVNALIDTLEQFMETTEPREMFKALLGLETKRIVTLIGFCVDTTVTAESLGLLPPQFLDLMKDIQSSTDSDE